MCEITKELFLPSGERLRVWDDGDISIMDIDGDDVVVHKKSIKSLIEELQKLI